VSRNKKSAHYEQQLRRELGNKKKLHASVSVVRRGSSTLELSRAFLRGDIYEDQKTSEKKYFSLSISRAVSEREMRWRRERTEKKFLMSWTVIQTTFGSCSLQAKVFVPEKLTSANYQLPNNDSLFHCALSYGLQRGCSLSPLMAGITSRIPGLICTSATLCAALVLPRLLAATWASRHL
jgi:hypothetical protein